MISNHRNVVTPKKRKEKRFEEKKIRHSNVCTLVSDFV